MVKPPGSDNYYTYVGEDQYGHPEGATSFAEIEKITFDSKAFGCDDCLKTVYTSPENGIESFVTQKGSLMILNKDGSISFSTGNEYGMVQFPESGPGFARYTTPDGRNNGNNENYNVRHLLNGPNGENHTTDNWSDPTTAADFYNTIQDFRSSYPNVVVHYGDISAYNPAINLGHGTHFTGKSIDIHYFGAPYFPSLNGVELHGESAYLRADKGMVDAFFGAAQRHGFTNNYSYGNRFSHIGNNNHAVHKDHLHIGQ